MSSQNKRWVKKNLHTHNVYINGVFIRIQMICLLCIAIVCVVLALVKLRKKARILNTQNKRIQENNDATVTMAWIASVFVMTNVIIVIIAPFKEYGEKVLLIAISLNSSLNPCIYLRRNKNIMASLKKVAHSQ